jgi:acyl carrier protein
MTHDEIFHTVVGVLREYFDDDDLQITPQTVADDVEDWDSISHVNIIVTLEQRFKIKFATSEVEAMKNVGQLVAMIEKKTA